MTKRRTVVAHLKSAVGRTERALIVAIRCREITPTEIKTMRGQLLAIERVTRKIEGKGTR